MNTLDFLKLKQAKEKITMVTCYDAWSAKIISETDIDCILVGDSLAMVMHGHDTTLPASVELMVLHTQAVARGASNKFIIADMPFLSYRYDRPSTMRAVQQLMQAGANAIKLEGAVGNIDTVQHIVESGVPVMGHLGLTPQSFHQLGGFKVQGKDAQGAEQLIAQAQQLEQAGCFAVVLECIPSALAKTISEALSIPTMGIGAGVETDGQVLVLQDLLGMDNTFKAKFIKNYLNGFDLVRDAVNRYHREVKQSDFPTEKESY